MYISVKVFYRASVSFSSLTSTMKWWRNVNLKLLYLLFCGAPLMWTHLQMTRVNRIILLIIQTKWNIMDYIPLTNWSLQFSRLQIQTILKKQMADPSFLYVYCGFEIQKIFVQ